MLTNFVILLILAQILVYKEHKSFVLDTTSQQTPRHYIYLFWQYISVLGCKLKKVVKIKKKQIDVIFHLIVYLYFI